MNALITAQAPLDLIAVASRFPLDEMVHVELCARLAGELGGPVKIMHDADTLIRRPNPGLSPRLRAAEMVVRNFCVGEAVSIPILRASWKAAEEPLVAAVLACIVKDEAAHGRFGWLYLDWLVDSLTTDERQHLTAAALDEIGLVERNWAANVVTDPARALPGTLGWMEPQTYLAILQISRSKKQCANYATHPRVLPSVDLHRPIEQGAAHRREARSNHRASVGRRLKLWPLDKAAQLCACACGRRDRGSDVLLWPSRASPAPAARFSCALGADTITLGMSLAPARSHA